METIKNLLVRFSHTGFLFIIGLILIMYIALGFLYFQQGPQQQEFGEHIVRLTTILSNPLSSTKTLQSEYEDANRSLAPMSDTDAIAMLVSIAKESGIDINEENGKFQIPTATFSQAAVGRGTYQLISFKGIHVQSNHDNVRAFISVLDSGSHLENMILTKVATNEVKVTTTGKERDKRAEFRSVISAVIDMMDKNDLLVIPNPMSSSRGTATNLMGDDIDTVLRIAGFPDITTTAVEKGYTGTDILKNGYVLYGHDEISTDDTTEYETVDYLTTLTTTYYYTSEADGTVRQWSSPDVDTATEYLDSEELKNELQATVDVVIYTTKPEGESVE